jgi:hypothetical protein
MAALVGLIVVLPVVVQGLPSSRQDPITRYLPSVAGQAVIGHTKFTPAGQQLRPWNGIGLFCAYLLAVLIAAGVVTNRRDA